MSRSHGATLNRKILGILGLVCILGLTLLIPDITGRTKPTAGIFPETIALSKAPLGDFSAYRAYFEGVAKKKGALYAFGVLRYAPIPSGVDIHLLAHYIGYVLYDQKGIAGITDCTQEFRNACSHSMVISVFRQFGEKALADIARTCEQAPGGRGAYTMCFHGLGHGILAYLGYDFEKALSVCKDAADAGARYERENPDGSGTDRFVNAWHECVGGAVMEMTSGVHDKAAWERMVPLYIPPADPLMPCDAAFMPDDVKPICYTYLTERFFESAGTAHGAVPAEETYKTVFSYCDRIPEKQKENRAACYGGIGKEFVGLANGDDIRTIGSLTDAELGKVNAWCALAGTPDAAASCRSSALASLFWGGENDPKASLGFCRLTQDPVLRSACYDELAKDALYFLGGTPGIARVCAGLPEPQRDFCFVNGT